MLLSLKKTPSSNLAAYFLLSDGSDACNVGFDKREHDIGTQGCFLDGVVVRMLEVHTPEHRNRYCCLLYHCNRGYSLAELVDSDTN